MLVRRFFPKGREDPLLTLREFRRSLAPWGEGRGEGVFFQALNRICSPSAAILSFADWRFACPGGVDGGRCEPGPAEAAFEGEAQGPGLALASPYRRC